MKIKDMGIQGDLKKVPCCADNGTCFNPVILITRWGRHAEPRAHAYASFCADHLQEAEEYIKSRREGTIR